MKRVIRIIFLLVLLVLICRGLPLPGSSEVPPCGEQNGECTFNGIYLQDDYDCVLFGGSCQSVHLCISVNQDDLSKNANCSAYPVKKINRGKFICFKNDQPIIQPCIEKELCNTISEYKTYKECRQYPVMKENSICVKKSDENGCEEKRLCPAERTLEENEECSNFVADDEKHVCAKGDNNMCKIEYSCKYVTGEEVSKELTDSDCNIYPVSTENKDTHICIKDKNDNKCIEQFRCESVKKDDNNNNEIVCSDYPVKLENTDTHICTENSNGDSPCIEKEKEKEKTSISTTIVKEIPKTTIVIPNIKTTSVISTSMIIQTTIPVQETKEEKKEKKKEEAKTETLVILLGFSQIIIGGYLVSFFVYFIPLTNTLYSTTLIIPLSILYYSALRSLEDSYAICTLNESNNQSAISYHCKVQTQNNNIKQIKLQSVSNFNFTSQSNVDFKGITPIAKMFMNNLEKIDANINNLLESNPRIYILDNSTIHLYENNNTFDISGSINGEKPARILKNKNLLLMISIENNETETENEISKETNCIVSDIINKNYVLNCKINDNNIYNVQSAVSVIEDGILVINIDKKIQKGIVYNPDSEEDKDNDNNEKITLFHSKKSKGLSAGTIVAIILSSIVALAAVIVIIMIFVRKRNDKYVNKESSMRGLNITNNLA